MIIDSTTPTHTPQTVGAMASATGVSAKTLKRWCLAGMPHTKNTRGWYHVSYYQLGLWLREHPWLSQTPRSVRARKSLREISQWLNGIDDGQNQSSNSQQ